VADDPPWPSDTFAHARHQRLACITCHDPRSNKKLTFEPGRGCQICHHQSPDRNNCSACHTPEEIAARAPVLTLTVTVRDHPPAPRSVTFDHAAHRSKSCTDCHTTPVTLAPANETVTCTACHAQHTAGAADCATCHSAAAASTAHAPPADAHRACAACHSAAIVATLTPTRTLCLTCHAPQRDHKPGAECTSCHLGTDPAGYRSRLTAGAGR
jgi:nitrate reductase cytochrome c-type subunit